MSKLCEDEHRYGTDTTNAPQTDWVAEANRTGEIFTESLIFWPRIDFGTTSREESIRSCQKNYSASSSHSPGIFKVCCACENHELFGLSVIRRLESISTALPVLIARFRRGP